MMIRNALLAAAATAALALVSSQALASACSDDQESTAGMLVAGVSKDAVSKVIAVSGKQMVNIDSCDYRAGTYTVDYKYNFLAADGLYWIQATAKFNADGSGGSVKVSKSSPNMAAAEAKAGVKLASN